MPRGTRGRDAPSARRGRIRRSAAAARSGSMAERVERAWGAVAGLARKARADGSAPDSIRPLFAADPARFHRFSRRADGLLLDLSKTAVTDAVLAALLDLAHAADLEGKRAAMAAGETVNATERRAVLHMALRAPRAAGVRTAGRAGAGG